MPESKVIEGYRYLDVKTFTVEEGVDSVKIHGQACTVSFQLDTDQRFIALGFAFRSPLDQMNRKLGRKISQGRRQCSRSQSSTTLEEGETIKQAAKRILTEGIIRFPRWMQDSVEGIYIRSEFA